MKHLIEVSSFTSNFFSPFMEIDPNTLKCSMTADAIFFVNRYNSREYIDNPNIAGYFNSALQSLFPTFPYKLNSLSSDLNYLLVFEDLNNVFTSSVTTNILSTLVDTTNTVTNINRPGIQIFQEVYCISLWSPISSIVFTSALLPIMPTQTSKPKL